jgi:hypothetical protein
MKQVIQTIRRKLGLSWTNEFGIKFAGVRRVRRIGKQIMKKHYELFKRLADN